jgi:hypothetical protein
LQPFFIYLLLTIIAQLLHWNGHEVSRAVKLSLSMKGGKKGRKEHTNENKKEEGVVGLRS